MIDASGGQVAYTGRSVDEDVDVGTPSTAKQNSVNTVEVAAGKVNVMKSSIQPSGKSTTVVVAFVADIVVTSDVRKRPVVSVFVSVCGGGRGLTVKVVQRRDIVRVKGPVKVMTWVVIGQLVGNLIVVVPDPVATTVVLNIDPAG